MRTGGVGGRRRSIALAVLVTVLAAAPLALAPSARAEPPPPIEIEIPSPAPGFWDPFDPPLVLVPDERLLGLDVPEHPWMLFDESELASLRSRILNAPAGSTVADAWERMRQTVDDPEFRSRDGFLAGLADPLSRRWGRDDLLHVAFVWKITGDDEYLDLARSLIGYALSIAPDHGAPIEPGVDEYYIQRAHRLNGFALAYDLLYHDLDPASLAQLRVILEGLANQHFVHANTAWWGLVSSGSNIGGNNAAALGTAALALYDENPTAPLWLARSEMLVRGYFHEGFDPEGAGIEGVLYGNYGMRIPTYLIHALERVGFGDLVDQGGLPGHQRWYAYEVLPGGGAVNPLNDARYYEINPTFTTWSIAHGGEPELSAWLFDNMTAQVPGGERSLGELIPTLLWYRPSDPTFDPADMLPLAEDYAARRGLVHVRTGWGDDDAMASFSARQSDWGEEVHHNQDVGQFTLYSDGAKLVVDSRYGNWLSMLTAGDFEAMRTSESEAHNVVVADGRSQDFFGKGALTGFATTATLGDPGSVDIAASDARLAWMTLQPRTAERCFLYSRRGPGTMDYLVVTDRMVQDGGSHAYTSYLHTDWRNAATVDGNSVSISSGEVPGVSLGIDLNVEGDAETRVGSFTPDDAQDWERIGEPGRKSHPRIETTHTGIAYNAIGVMIPRGQSEQPPSTTHLDATGGIATRVDHTPAVDTILLATGTAPTVAAAGIETDAACALVRTTPAGVTRVALSGGTFVDVDGERLLEVDGGPATVAWDGVVPLAAEATPAPASTGAQSAVAATAPVARRTLPATGTQIPAGVAGFLLVFAAAAHVTARRA